MRPVQIDAIALTLQLADEYSRTLETQLVGLEDVRPRLQQILPSDSRQTIGVLVEGLVAGLLRDRAVLVDPVTRQQVTNLQGAVAAASKHPQDDGHARLPSLTLCPEPGDRDPQIVDTGHPLAAMVAVAVDTAEGMSRELDEDYEGLFGLPGHLRFGLPQASDDDIINLSHAVLLALQRTGVIAVDPDSFEPWPDQTDFPAEIIRQWRALGRDPRLPDIAWLERPAPAS